MKIEMKTPRKKLTMTIIGDVALFWLLFTGQITADQFLMSFTGLNSAFAISQGVADHGKDRRDNTLPLPK